MYLCTETPGEILTKLDTNTISFGNEHCGNQRPPAPWVVNGKGNMLKKN